jgi:hypothetical protein
MRRDFDDLLQNVVHLLHHLKITEAHDFNALSVQIARPALVMDQSRRFTVLSTIQLDRQPQLGTVKIQHVEWAGILTAKFQIGDLPGAKLLPEQVFAVGLFDAELAGELGEGRAILHASRSL